MKVIVRKFNPTTDTGIIYSSYPKGVFYGSLDHKEVDKATWFKAFFIIVKDQLLTADISIACLENDHNHILGYSIINNNCLNFIYVKQEMRNQGIAKLLIKSKTINSINNLTMTKVGNAIYSSHKDIIKE